MSEHPHPECVEAYHRELLLTGRTIMSVARVRRDVADAEAGRAVQDDGLPPDIRDALTVGLTFARMSRGGSGPNFLDRFNATRRDFEKRANAILRAAPPLHDPQEPER